MYVIKMILYSTDEQITKKRWDEIHRNKKEMMEVDESIPEIVEIFKEKNVKRVLDLGCGSGRHTIHLAQQGFDVYGIDISTEGIKRVTQRLTQMGLHATITSGSIYRNLPYGSNFFDAIISVKVIHHGRIENIRKAIKEMERVLKPKGVIFLSVRKRAARKTLPYKQIAPRTYIKQEGIEKDIVHYLFTKKLLKNEFENFRIHHLWVDSHNYYCLLAEKPEK